MPHSVNIHDDKPAAQRVRWPMRLILSVLFLFVLLALWPTQQSDGHWLEPTLKHSWTFYKTQFMKTDAHGSRVRSNHYKGTITEGQSYALLKSVWMNDPDTFERTWQWTRSQMKRPHDHLLGWRWGERSDGTTGLIETENAADADQDIAYALILASTRWDRSDYQDDAKAIIRDLWTHNVRRINNRYYLLPGTWDAFEADYLTVNPSYLAPYVYRKFAKVDKEHAQGWEQLADNVYPTLEACTNLTRLKLPPNWCSVDWKTGTVGWSDKQGAGSRDFSYDAVRVFWRMATDAAIDDSAGTGRARTYLRSHPGLTTAWKRYQGLPGGFSPEGTPLNPDSSGADSGFTMSAMLAQHHILAPQDDRALYEKTLKPYYHHEGYWFNSYNDFLHSVIWFHLHTLTR